MVGLRLELISCLVLLKADMFVKCCSVPKKRRDDDDDVQLRGLWTVGLVRGMRKETKKRWGRADRLQGSPKAGCQVGTAQEEGDKVEARQAAQPEWRCHGRLVWGIGAAKGKYCGS